MGLPLDVSSEVFMTFNCLQELGVYTDREEIAFALLLAFKVSITACADPCFE